MCELAENVLKLTGNEAPHSKLRGITELNFKGF